MPFESPFGVPGCFEGTISAIPAHEDTPPGGPPQTIIRTDQSWHIHVSWTTTGSCTGMVGGQWHLHAVLESMGPGQELILTDPADHFIPLTPGPSPVNYSRTINIPAGRVNPGPTGTLVYKLVVTLTYVDLTGSPGPMAAYVELPMIQFYRPRP